MRCRGGMPLHKGCYCSFFFLAAVHLLLLYDSHGSFSVLDLGRRTSVGVVVDAWGVVPWHPPRRRRRQQQRQQPHRLASASSSDWSGGWRRGFYTYPDPASPTAPRPDDNSVAAVATGDPTTIAANIFAPVGSSTPSYNISYHYCCCCSSRTDDARPIHSTTATAMDDTTNMWLLLHPVGIGMASWFWQRLGEATITPDTNNHPWNTATTSNEEEENNRDSAAKTKTTTLLYAVNLLGCGATTEQSAAISHTDLIVDDDNDDQQQHSASVSPPQQLIRHWIAQCECLVETVILPSLSSSSAAQNSTSVTIVVQGGMAPLAIALATRHPHWFRALVFTSPPPWTELTRTAPRSALARNYAVLRGPLGAVAFEVLLETRWAIQFFSNLFLFGSNNAASSSCDSVWLDQALAEAGPGVRFPVQVFNAGYCQVDDYDPVKVWQEPIHPIPTLILQGTEDGRNLGDEQQNWNQPCRVVRVPGKNVLPWESPVETSRAIRDFLHSLSNNNSSSSSSSIYG